MQLVDVNVLVYAHREDTPDHARFRSWLESWLSSESAFGMSDLVLSGFVRIVTHPRVFVRPTPLRLAIQFAETIRSRSNHVAIVPGPRHWDIFSRLCSETDARGNLVPDAYLAALAIESGSEWITTDRDYSRFSGLRWRHPFEGLSDLV
jgi:toxin-antitoxin system PIN domain toxin